MKILTDPISSFSFQDIVSFCDEGHVEGTQLDYKKEVPKSLAKHFAAFSNTRGGVIIVGSDEDKKNGKPKDYTGIKDDSKVVDRIHQFASNVTPRPRYELHRAENSTTGRMFVLIKIHEGDKTPYYVQNDPHVYIRTGNISDLVEQAGPEMLELLFKKREKAETARQVWIKRSEETFLATIRKAIRDREQNILEEHPQDAQDRISKLRPIGSGRPMFSFFIQPYYPLEPFCDPIQMKDRVMEYRAQTRFFSDFPDLNIQPFQDGILATKWEEGGLIDFHQLYSYGLVRRDRALHEDTQRKHNSIYIQHAVAYFFTALTAARNFYRLFGYQGVLVGEIAISGVEGRGIMKIIPSTWHDFYGEQAKGLLNRYNWPIEVETSVLEDEKSLRLFVIQKINEIYWSFGLEHPAERLLKALFKEMGWNWVE